MPTITIDASTIVQGHSTQDNVPNGGFSPLTKGINLLKSEGVLYPQPSTTELGTGTIEDTVYLRQNATFTSGVGTILVDAVGNVYHVKRTDDTVTKKFSTLETIDFDSDICAYKDNYYIADSGSTKDIIQLNAPLSASDASWWRTTEGKGALVGRVRRLLVVEDTMYILESNKIHTYDGTTSVEDAMELPESLHVTEAVRHPNGRDIIAFTAGGGYTASHSNWVGARMYIIDTVNLEWTKELELPAVIDSAYVVSGIVYVFSGNRIGYLTDTNIEWITDIETTLGDEDTLVRKSRVFTYEGYLGVAVGGNVLLIGDFGGGTRFCWLVDTASTIGAVDYFGGTDIVYVTDADEVHKVDLTDGDGVSTVTTNRYSFPQKVWVRRIEIHHDVLESGDSFTVGHNDAEGTSAAYRTVTFTDVGAKKRTRIDCNTLTDLYQLYLTWNAGDVGVHKIIIHYESGE